LDVWNFPPLSRDFLNDHKVLALVDMTVHKHSLASNNPLRFSDGFSLPLGGAVLIMVRGSGIGLTLMSVAVRISDNVGVAGLALSDHVGVPLLLPVVRGSEVGIFAVIRGSDNVGVPLCLPVVRGSDNVGVPLWLPVVRGSDNVGVVAVVGADGAVHDSALIAVVGAAGASYDSVLIAVGWDVVAGDGGVH
jgi:hypothetical protein